MKTKLLISTALALALGVSNAKAIDIPTKFNYQFIGRDTTGESPEYLTGTDVVLDGTSHTGTYGQASISHSLTIGEGATVLSTIQSKKADLWGEIYVGGTEENKGTLTLDGGTVYVDGMSGLNVVPNQYADINIKSGTLIGRSPKFVPEEWHSDDPVSDAIIHSGYGDINISGGTIDLVDSVILKSNAEENSNSGNINISGGTFNLNGADVASQNKLNITGGTFTMTDTDLSSGNDALLGSENTDMLIQNTTITATNSDIESTHDITINNAKISLKSTDTEDEIYGVWAENDLNITGSDTVINAVESYLVSAHDMKISGGTINISNTFGHALDPYMEKMPAGANMAGSIVGIYSENYLIISGGEINLDASARAISGVQMSGGTLNLNTKTFDEASTLWSYGDITFSGGTVNMTSTLEDDGSNVVTFASSDDESYKPGNITISGATVNVSGYGNMFGTEGVLSMTSGTLNVNKDSSLDLYAECDKWGHVYDDTPHATLQMSGGTLNVSGELYGNLDFSAGKINVTNTSSENDAKIKSVDTGDVINISGGEIYLNNGNLKAHSGNMNITGGTITAIGDSEIDASTTNISGDSTTVKLSNGASIGADSILNISGGTIDADNAIISSGPYDENEGVGLIRMTGGTINMQNSKLIADSYNGGGNPDMRDAGNLQIMGGTINVKSGDNIIMTSNDSEVSHISGKNTVVNIANGSTLSVYETYDDEAKAFANYGTLNLLDKATINLSGTLFANIDGNEAGTLNFNAANAKVNGTINGGVINFNKDNTLSNAITGAVTANTLNVNAGTFTIDRGIEVGNFNVIGGTTNIVSSELEASGIISITGGNTILNQGELKAHDGSLNISGGTLTLTNDSEVWAGTTTVSDSAVVNVTDSEFSGDKTLNIQGGTITLNNSYMMPDEGTAGNPSLFNMTGGTVNLNNSAIGSQLDSETEVFDAGSSILAGGVINALSGNNTFLMKDVEVKNTVNVANGATLNVFEKYDDDAESFNTKGTLNLVNNGTINLSGKLYADVDGTDAGALNFNAANAVVDGDVENVNVTFNADNTLSKAITGSLDYVTSLNIAKGTLIFDRAVSLDSLNVASVLDAGLNKVEIGGDANFAATSTLKIEIAEDDNGSFKANNINVEDGAKLAFNITKKMEIGEELKDIALLDGNLNGVFKNQLPNSRYTITSEDNKVFNIMYDASASDVVIDAGGSSGNAATAEAWDTLVNQEGVSAQAKAVASVLVDLSQNATTPEGKKAYIEALTVLAPETAPAVQQVSTENANQVFGAVGTRLSGGSVATSRQGVSSGDANGFEGAAWVQMLYNKSKYDKSSTNKFDADTKGVAFGLEKYFSDEVKAGIGYAYNKSDIDGFKRHTDVKTHTAIVYGEYKPNNWFVNGIAAYGWSDYEEKKKVGGIGIKADWDVESFALQAMTGYNMNIKGYGFTPETGLRYVHIKNKAYKNSADERIKSSDSDVVTGVIGARLNKTYAYDSMSFRPELKAAMTYDLANDDTKSVVTLVNGSSYSVSGKALNRFGVELGAGLTAEVNENVELSVGYEGKFRQDYQDHTGLINAKYKF